jgi:sec-independent protein translocase protein TatA
MNLGNFSGGELLVLAVLFLLIFGAHRLPEAGKAVGKGIREFKRALTEAEDAIRSDQPPAPRAPDLGRSEGPKRLVD